MTWLIQIIRILANLSTDDIKEGVQKNLHALRF